MEFSRQNVNKIPPNKIKMSRSDTYVSPAVIDVRTNVDGADCQTP